MTSRDGNLVRLLAGSSADERRPPSQPGPEREWYLPAHARQPGATRERMSAQVAAGADVLLAHTFLTHRRALRRVGEARRARELTQSAVALAREAAEQGRDRRDPDLPWAKQPVSVVGALPLLGDDPGSGQLGPLDVAIARDLHDHAGLLADAGVDLIIVEGPRTLAETAAGVRAGRSMGIETWAVVDHHGLPADPEDLGAPDAILLTQATAATAATAADGSGLPASWSGPHGVLVDMLFDGLAEGYGPALRDLIAAGASVLGIGDGATPDRLAIVRAAIDDHERAHAREHDTEASSWLDWVARGAAMAPPGTAVWLAERPPPTLTPGRDWTVAPPGEIWLMPAGRYRLVVAETFEPAFEQLALRLELGGVLVATSDRSVPLPDELQLLDLRDAGTQHWLIARRR
ncbi:MAG: homocysteine S-methyltransferase family protein [Chloroflexi bacterium]|nr:homocysteine S-methyltransferase family protein [Chloroflexota bacterium]